MEAGVGNETTAGEFDFLRPRLQENELLSPELHV